ARGRLPRPCCRARHAHDLCGTPRQGRRRARGARAVERERDPACGPPATSLVVDARRAAAALADGLLTIECPRVAILSFSHMAARAMPDRQFCRGSSLPARSPWE